MKNNHPIDLEVVAEHSVNERIDLINHYNASAMLSAAQSSAFMIMAGAELLALKSQVKHGEWEGLFRDPANRKALSDLPGGGPLFGFTSRSARTYMSLAEAARKNIPELRTLPIGRIAIADMTHEDQEALVKAVHKRADGHTFQQLAWEWNLAKVPQGSATTGGGPGGSKPRAALSLPEQEEALRMHAREQWALIDRGFFGYEDKFILLPRVDIEGQIALLEIQLQARKRFLAGAKPGDVTKLLKA